MTKEWTCEQCGGTETRSLVGHLRNGAPDECPNCGNREFDETTFGGLHSAVDAVLG